MYFTPKVNFYLPAGSKVVDRITFYDRPELTIEESKLFRGGFYAVILAPAFWTDWTWYPQERKNKRQHMQFTYTPKLPFKGELSDEVILKYACGSIEHFGSFTKVEIFETQVGR